MVQLARQPQSACTISASDVATPPVTTPSSEEEWASARLNGGVVRTAAGESRYVREMNGMVYCFAEEKPAS